MTVTLRAEEMVAGGELRRVVAAAWTAAGQAGYLLGLNQGQVTVEGPDAAAADRIRALAAGENWLAGSGSEKD